MKHLIKTSLLLIALLAASSVCVSCVEDEKEPSFTDGGETDNIDVKMPAPYTVSLNLGSEVILKGSGFSQRDEVYVQQRVHNDSYDEGYGDYGTTGAKVKAKITKYTSTELTFIIPDDALGGENSGEAYVFFRRNGKEYKLGYMSIEPLDLSLMTGQPSVGGQVTVESRTPSVSFSQSDKIFLQKVELDYNGRPIGTGDKIQAEVIAANPNQLTFVVPFGLDVECEYFVFVEQSERKFRLELTLFVIPLRLRIQGDNGGLFYAGSKAYLIPDDEFSFLRNDKVYLQHAEWDDMGQLIGMGEKISANVVDINSRMLSFELPSNISGNYNVYLVRGEVSRTIDIIYIESPVRISSSSLSAGSEFALYSNDSQNFKFTGSDKVYLQPVKENAAGEYEDKGSRVEIEITWRDYSALSCKVPAGFSGTYAVILIHKGVEYRVEEILTIYAY
mgnify:CR=1 FL=1